MEVEIFNALMSQVALAHDFIVGVSGQSIDGLGAINVANKSSCGVPNYIYKDRSNNTYGIFFVAAKNADKGSKCKYYLNRIAGNFGNVCTIILYENGVKLPTSNDYVVKFRYYRDIFLNISGSNDALPEYVQGFLDYLNCPLIYDRIDNLLIVRARQILAQSNLKSSLVTRPKKATKVALDAPLSQQPFSNDFVFGQVMSSSKIANRFMRALTGDEVTDFVSISRQMDMKDFYAGHGTRLDVYLKDIDGIIGIIEIQNKKNKDEEIRAVCYVANARRETLNKGEDYLQIRDIILVMVCNFDPYGLGKAVYKWRTGVERTDIEVNTHSSVYFLNSCYKEPNTVSEILEFLDYVRVDKALKNPSSELVQMIQSAVVKVQSSEVMDAMYNKYIHEMQVKYLEGKIDGIESERRNMASKMFGVYPDEEIARLLELSTDKIQGLKQELSGDK